MAKDPAFLFYPNDWIGGTMGMTFEEKGAYIELLMLQFNRGHMTSHMIAQTVGQIWDKIQDKFVRDDEGLWFNERLELEKNKRQNFTKSRRNNRFGNNQHTKKQDKNTPDKIGHMTSHMIEHMENENVNENIGENKGGLGEEREGPPIGEVERVFIQQGGTKEMALLFWNKHDAMGWRFNGHPIKNYARLVTNFIINFKEIQKQNERNPKADRNGGFGILAEELKKDMAFLAARKQGGAGG